MNSSNVRYAALRRAVILAGLLSLWVLGPGAGWPPAVRPALGRGALAGDGPDPAGPVDTVAPDDQVSLLVSLEGPTLWELY